MDGLPTCGCISDAAVYFGGDSDALSGALGLGPGEARPLGAGEAGPHAAGSFDDGEARSAALAPSLGTAAEDVAGALKNLTTSVSECAERPGAKPGEPCSSKAVVSAIRAFRQLVAPKGAPAGPPPGGGPLLPTADTKDAAVVREVAGVLGCGSESCVVTHSKFRDFAIRTGTHPGELERNITGQFKPKGPRDSVKLLNNINIDSVLQGWAVRFPDFFNIPFCMMDFESEGGSLARVDAADILEGRERQSLGPAGGMVRRPCATFACVLNTDVTSGKGKHWVALFGDCRGQGDWSLEYFNSAGNPPPAPVTRWMEKTATRLRGHRADNLDRHGDGDVAAVPLTDVRHQDSRTECGLYSLYFIRRRLEGAPAAEFRGGRIPDEAMTRFRAHVFRDS